jgi:hypothetical protein
MYRKTDVQIYTETYRNKDLQKYTDKLTDRQCRSEGRQIDKQTDVRKAKRSNILCILRYRQTDRQDRHKRMTNRPTYRQTDSI